jgi:PadR family transcriptional regulator PadR
MKESSWSTQIKKGLLELCILNLLAQENMYGYQLVKRLTSIPGFVVSEGTIYPLLSRLKQEGVIESSLIESSIGPVRRTYSLTEHGQRHLSEINEIWQKYAAGIADVIQRSSTDGGSNESA